MRIKRGTTKKQKHKKVLKAAKGYRMSYSKNYRRAIEAVAHAGQYSFAHRRRRASQMRSENIKIISAALVNFNIGYSSFVNMLGAKKIEINRQVISTLANFHKDSFNKLVSEVSK